MYLVNLCDKDDDDNNDVNDNNDDIGDHECLFRLGAIVESTTEREKRVEKEKEISNGVHKLSDL